MSQPFDPAPDSAEIAAATERFLDTAQTLSDADVPAPSSLPGWSRGHVLTHVARNADSLVNLLGFASTGIEKRQYPSPEARTAGIEEGSGRPLDAQVADIAAAHSRFSAAVDAVPPDRWQFDVRRPDGDPYPAYKILEARLREVAVHHLDLDAGYTAAQWSPAFALRILRSVVRPFEVRDMAPVTLIATDVDGRVEISGGSNLEIRGPAHALATWLLGRDDGPALAVTGGALPKPPAW